MAGYQTIPCGQIPEHKNTIILGRAVGVTFVCLPVYESSFLEVCACTDNVQADGAKVGEGQRLELLRGPRIEDIKI